MKVALLLLHGALGESTQFDLLVQELKNDFEILTLDFEGHGKAEMRERPFCIQHFAENVLEFLEEKKMAPLIFLDIAWAGMLQ